MPRDTTITKNPTIIDNTMNLTNFLDCTITPTQSLCSNDTQIFNEMKLTQTEQELSSMYHSSLLTNDAQTEQELSSMHHSSLLTNELCKIHTELKKIQDTLLYMNPIPILSNNTNVIIPVKQFAHIEEQKSIDREMQHKLHSIVCDKLHTLHEEIKTKVLDARCRTNVGCIDKYFEQLFTYTDKLYRYDPLAYVLYKSWVYIPYATNPMAQVIRLKLYLITTHNVYNSSFCFSSNYSQQFSQTDLLQSRIYTFNAPVYYNYPIDIFNGLIVINEHFKCCLTNSSGSDEYNETFIQQDKLRFETLIQAMYNLIPGVKLSKLRPGWTEIYNIHG